MPTFISPPILPVVLSVPDHDEYRDIWKARIASSRDAESFQSDGLSDHRDSSDESIHLFGDERDHSSKRGSGTRKRYATAVDVITATEQSLASLSNKMSSSGAASMRPGKVACGEPKFSEWTGRISREQHIDYVHDLNTKKREKAQENRMKDYRPGACVSTKNKKVATDEVAQVSKKKGAHREPVFGILIDTSPMDEAYWLVKFYNNKLYYCYNKVLKFVDHKGDDRVLNCEQLRMMDEARYKHLEGEIDYMLKRMLFPLPVKVPSTNPISVGGIVKRLEPFHPWLEESDLRRFITYFQQKRLSTNNGKTDQVTKSTKPTAFKNSSFRLLASGSTNKTRTKSVTNDASTQTDKTSQSTNASSSNTATQNKRVRRPETQRYINKVYNSFDSSDDELPHNKKPFEDNEDKPFSNKPVRNTDKALSTTVPKKNNSSDTYPAEDQGLIDKVLGKTRCDLSPHLDTCTNNSKSNGKYANTF